VRSGGGGGFGPALAGLGREGGEACADGEEVGLDGGELCPDLLVVEDGDRPAERGVELVDLAVGFDARVRLGESSSSEEAGVAPVAGAGVDADATFHGVMDSSGWCGRAPRGGGHAGRRRAWWLAAAGRVRIAALSCCVHVST